MSSGQQRYCAQEPLGDLTSPSPTLNTECQVGRPRGPFLQSLVRPGQGLNPKPYSLRMDTLPLDHWAGFCDVFRFCVILGLHVDTFYIIVFLIIMACANKPLEIDTNKLAFDSLASFPLDCHWSRVNHLWRQAAITDSSPNKKETEWAKP